MNVLVTGAAGFVAGHIIPHFIEKGHEVTAVDRNDAPVHLKSDYISYIRADTSRPGSWQKEAARADAVVNLAGRNIFSRWTEKYKKSLYDSRIQTTRNLVEALDEADPPVLCSTSAVGYYGDKKDSVVDERAGPGDDFLARLAMDWENTALAAEKKGARVVLTRFALVMAKNGGALSAMLPAFRYFLGGPMADGKHWMSWIHVHDLARAMVFAIENTGVSGAVNFTAPNPVQNAEFAETLARVLNRPAFFRVPRFALKAALGELAEMMLYSQRAVPARLEQAGFEFKYPDLEDALKQELITGEK